MASGSTERVGAAVRLGQKLVYLRELAGRTRGLDRPLSKAEAVRLMRAELGTAVSQAYLSQLELGRRVHLSAHTRALLARFFRVHPGYLVDDLPGAAGGPAGLSDGNAAFGNWLDRPAAERADPALARVVAKLSNVAERGRYLALFERLLELPIEATEAALRAQANGSGRAGRGASEGR